MPEEPGEGEMTHKRLDRPAYGDAGSPAEVCVNSGLLCGPGRGVFNKVRLEVTFSPNIESVVSG